MREGKLRARRTHVRIYDLVRSWQSMTLPIALWLASACGARWHREELTPERRLAARQQVQFWSGHQSQVLHAVILGPDSVSGVPFHLPPACDSCRVVVARSAMDSIRLGNQERGALRSLGLGYVALGVAALVLYFSVDTD